jgi:L-serine deaminase
VLLQVKKQSLLQAVLMCKMNEKLHKKEELQTTLQLLFSIMRYSIKAPNR